MTEASRGVLDTSALIDHDQIAADQLPDESAITAVTLAELAAVPHVYGRVFAAARAAGQSSTARFADLLIASAAASHGLPLYTRNPSDFAALKRNLKVVKA